MCTYKVAKLVLFDQGEDLDTFKEGDDRMIYYGYKGSRKVRRQVLWQTIQFALFLVSVIRGRSFVTHLARAQPT